MRRREILLWLKRNDGLEELYAQADQTRRQQVGDEVHLRGLVEISNICRRQCGYCGLRAENVELERYRMTWEEILQAAQLAASLGYGTVVLQAGESEALSASWIADVVREIKRRTPLAVTLSLGERDDDELRQWREAGADRYLLRFETSDPELYKLIHPAHKGQKSDRVAQLRRMREMGYEIGSGVMVGIPGQSYESLARDLMLFRTLDLDMIGVGPYIPHPRTPLGSGLWRTKISPTQQVPNSEEMVYKVVALTRLLCPQANIPSTTALATINQQSGRELGLMRGANVVMPNLTPQRYRRFYEIYPNKVCIGEQPSDCSDCLRGRIAAIGRLVGRGPGARQGLQRTKAFTSKIPAAGALSAGTEALRPQPTEPPRPTRLLQLKPLPADESHGEQQKAETKADA